jgi:hypothetical protein
MENTRDTEPPLGLTFVTHIIGQGDHRANSRHRESSPFSLKVWAFYLAVWVHANCLGYIAAPNSRGHTLRSKLLGHLSLCDITAYAYVNPGGVTDGLAEPL